MKKARIALVALLGAAVMAAVGGGAAWWWLGRSDVSETQEPMPDTREYKYVNLDKVIVMLRGSVGEPLSHYMAMDLVFKTPVEHEKVVKQQLPLLRSIAVRTMSAYTLEKATMMTVEQFAADINAAYMANYAAGHTPMPFVETLIGKLIIE